MVKTHLQLGDTNKSRLESPETWRKATVDCLQGEFFASQKGGWKSPGPSWLSGSTFWTLCFGKILKNHIILYIVGKVDYSIS